jgi:uridine phosphorylase
MAIQTSELIINPDGSIYHLNLKPEHVADTVIFVGDPDRVERVTQHFDRIEFSIQKREFKTQTGYLNKKRITVISTGIGTDNIDIVVNELDALVNIDFKTRQIKPKLKQLDIVRIGTSGTIQPHINLDSYIINTHGLDLSGTLQAYNTQEINNSNIANTFIAQTSWSASKSSPLIIQGNTELISKFESSLTLKGLTATANGFYGPQGRKLRLALEDPLLNKKMADFSYKGLQITNIEMETSGIYGLAKLLGHRAVSLNAILANRANGTFSKTPKQTIENLITYTLERI